MYSNLDDHLFEKAVSFLVKQINESGHNEKPVILHSIRVAMILYKYNYNNDVILGALLHDLCEDSQTSLSLIESEFGNNISQIVGSLTLNSKIKDKKERFLDTVERSLKIGTSAVLIRTADLIDNSNYYHLAPTLEAKSWLIEKNKIFLERAKKLINKDEIFKILEEKN